MTFLAQLLGVNRTHLSIQYQDAKRLLDLHRMGVHPAGSSEPAEGYMARPGAVELRHVDHATCRRLLCMGALDAPGHWGLQGVQIRVGRGAGPAGCSRPARVRLGLRAPVRHRRRVRPPGRQTRRHYADLAGPRAQSDRTHRVIRIFGFQGATPVAGRRASASAPGHHCGLPPRCHRPSGRRTGHSPKPALLSDEVTPAEVLTDVTAERRCSPNQMTAIAPAVLTL